MIHIAHNNRNNWNLEAIAFNNIFDPIFNDGTTSDSIIPGKPVVNISETDTHYYIKLEIHGLKKKEFVIHLDRKILNIKKKSSKTESIQLFALPDSVDKRNIKTKCTKGILKFRIPKIRNMGPFISGEISQKH